MLKQCGNFNNKINGNVTESTLQNDVVSSSHLWTHLMSNHLNDSTLKLTLITNGNVKAMLKCDVNSTSRVYP